MPAAALVPILRLNAETARQATSGAQLCRGMGKFLTCQSIFPLLYSASRLQGGGSTVVVVNFPKCQKCDLGDLVPLSDFGSQGAAIYFKAWACTNPSCGFNIKIRNGDLYIDEPISSGAMHTPRVRA
jgi:hypothetical protein